MADYKTWAEFWNLPGAERYQWAVSLPKDTPITGPNAGVLIASAFSAIDLHDVIITTPATSNYQVMCSWVNSDLNVYMNNVVRPGEAMIV